MVRLALLLHGVTAILTRPLSIEEAEARRAAWGRYYYRVGHVVETPA